MITPSLATFLITLINIGILFFVLRAVLFKPVTAFMEKRTASIQQSLDTAQQEKKEAAELKRRYEEQLKAVDREAESRIKQAEEQAKKQAESILLNAQQEAEKFLVHARAQIEAERHAAFDQFRAEAALLVVQASSRLVQRELNTEDNRRFADLLIREARHY
ncbi:F-type H+-transporting ATPase subunit b [Pillotina sp. SPG140]|jgi:F-type H+-transporting ATPase subunit b